MSRASHLLRAMTWRGLMLVVHIALLNRADAHYVDTTGEVPAWAIESLNPELDKITNPDNTLDNHHPYYAKPEMVYPSPKWTWEVYTESNKVDFPVSPKFAPHTRLKNQSAYGILNSRPSFSNPKFAKKHSKTSDHNWSVEMMLNEQNNKIYRNQQFSGSSPIPWKHGHSPPNVGAPKKGHAKPLHANFDFHHSFQDPIFSRHKEETPKVSYGFNNQRNVHRQERSKKPHNSEINLHGGISDTSAISKHEVQGYKNFQSSSMIKEENIPFPRTNFRSLRPHHVGGVTRQADETKTDRKRKRDVPLLDNAFHTIPPHDQLPWTYHDNLPQRVRTDHVNAGVPLGWDGYQAFGINKFPDAQHVPVHRDNANLFLPPVLDIFVDEADYDYITSLVENNEGFYNTDQKHHVFEPPLTYHVEHVFGGGSIDSHKDGFGGGSINSDKGGFGGGSTGSHKGEFGGGSTASHKGGFGGGSKGSLTHFDSSSLDLDYNVQYDFGVPETQALKGDAAIVEHGSGYAGHSAHSFGQFEGGNIHGSGGHSNLGGELYSSGFPQKGGHGFGHSDKAGHKFPSADTVIQFGGQGFGSGYNFDSGHQKGHNFGSKDTIVESFDHGFESGDGFHHSAGDYTLDSGDIVYFDHDHNSGGKKIRSTAGNKFGHSGGPNFSSGDAFLYSGESNVGFQNKFSRPERSKPSPRTKFTDSLRPGIDSTDKFSHFKEQGFGSEDKFTHSGGSNFGHEDEYIPPEKSSFIQGQLFHSERSNFGSPGDLFKFRNHEFSSTDGAHHSGGGFGTKRGLSHHQGGQDEKDVLSLFRPIGHDFGPTDVQSKEITHKTSKSVTTDPTFFDYSSSKLLSNAKHLNRHPEVPFSRSKEGRLDYSHSGIQDVSKRSVDSSLDGSQPLYVETSSGETVPSNFYDPTSFAIKEELPNTFFINPEKHELSNNNRPTSRDRNAFFSQANKSAGLKPAHLLTPSSYDHDSGFHGEELGMHRGNLTFISLPKNLGLHSREHSTQKEESISPKPKGYETYVHLPPNTTPKDDVGLTKSEFAQPVESPLYDYPSLRQGEGLDQTEQRNVEPNTGVMEHATTQIRSSGDIEEEEADDYYHVDGEYSAPEYDDAHLDETNEKFLPGRGNAMYVRSEPDEEHRQQDCGNQLQPPSQGDSEDIAYYDDKYYGDKRTVK